MHLQENSWSSRWSSQAGGGLAKVFSTGFSKVSKGLVAFLLLGYVAKLVLSETVDCFALIPGKTIPFGWNVVTAGYLELSFVGLVVSAVCILAFGKILQPIWGSREFLKFIIVVNFLAGIGTFIFAIVLYYATASVDFLVHTEILGAQALISSFISLLCLIYDLLENRYTPIAGFHGAIAGFVVAIKQIMPDQEYTRFKLKVRAKWLPSILVLGSVILSIILKDPIRFLPFHLFGTYGAWLYLRYAQRKPETTYRGDPSDEFAFATFFPEFLSPAVNIVATVVERIICGRSHLSDERGNGYPLGGKPLPGSDPADASRRRERGARALEERLNANTNPAGTEPAAQDGAPTLPLSVSATESLDAADMV